MFRIRIRWILVGWIRIQKDKNYPLNRKKGRNFLFWSSGCSLLRSECLSCGLNVLYVSLGISILKFCIKKKLKTLNFFQLKTFSIFDHQNCGSRTGSGSELTWNAGCQRWKQCGSETLLFIDWPFFGFGVIYLFCVYTVAITTICYTDWHHIKKIKNVFNV